MRSSLPKATVERLPLYLRYLDELPGREATVASSQLAQKAGVNSANVRKDLSYLGSYGVRGVGYDVDHLRHQIEGALGLTGDCAIAIVGAGNLGRALVKYDGFRERGFRIVGVFDVDDRKIGMRIDGRRVEDVAALTETVAQRRVRIGVIATPASAAQMVAELLVASGVRSILNFAPVVLRAPDGVEVRRVDLSTELQILNFYLKNPPG